LSRLVSDGLVTLEGQRGFRVPSTSVEEAIDIEQTRCLLEVEALRQAIAHGGEDWEAGIVASYHKLRKIESAEGNIATLYVQWEQRNTEFHNALVGACPSNWILN